MGHSSRPTNKNILLDHVDTDPESVVSDYSEMADAIKEHLANVQIIRQEDLDSGNALPNEFLVQRKIPRLPEETEAEYAKRLRKLNFLSLAQEFAELKKVDSEALPFGAHKAHLQSPLSESSMSETGSNPSSLTTPMETSKEFPPAKTSNIPSNLDSGVSKPLNNVKEAWKDTSESQAGQDINPVDTSGHKQEVGDEPDSHSHVMDRQLTAFERQHASLAPHNRHSTAGNKITLHQSLQAPVPFGIIM